MSKVGKIVLTIVILVVGSLMLGISKEIPALNAGWIRILIGTAGGGAMIWIWTKDKGKD